MIKNRHDDSYHSRPELRGKRDYYIKCYEISQFDAIPLCYAVGVSMETQFMREFVHDVCADNMKTVEEMCSRGHILQCHLPLESKYTARSDIILPMKLVEIQRWLFNNFEDDDWIIHRGSVYFTTKDELNFFNTFYKLST